MSSKSVFYSLVLLNILTEGGVVRATTTVTPVNRGPGGLFEITDDKSPTKVPDVEPLTAGNLDTGTRTFDLVVTGSCTTGEDPKLDIKPGAVRPDFFHVDGNSGKLVYAEPQPMTIITMPKGHSALVDITLSNVNHIDSMAEKVKDYICLGIRRDGVISDEVLYTKDNDTTHASAMIEMNSEDIVELVPLLSITALSSGYTKAIPGSEATLVSESIDFSSVYRVNIQAFGPDTPMDVEWEDIEDCGLKNCNLSGGYKIGAGSVRTGDGVYQDQLLVVNKVGDIVYSSNGVTWDTYGSLINEGESCNDGWNKAGIAYGNGMWCVAGTQGVKYLRDNDDHWSSLDTQITGINALTFGNHTFVAQVDSSVYTLSGNNVDWKQLPGQLPTSNALSIIYHNSTWMALRDQETYEYDVANAEWKSLGANYPRPSNYGGWNSHMYVHGYFYSCYDDVDTQQVIARSLNGVEWVSFESNFGHSMACRSIVVCNNKLYAFSYDHFKCQVGTFVKPKP